MVLIRLESLSTMFLLYNISLFAILIHAKILLSKMAKFLNQITKNFLKIINKATKIRGSFKFLWKPIFLIVVAFNIFLASWYLLNGNLNFGTDLARDFLLLNQIEEKKFMLIGARAGAASLFHGPLWSYLNFPIYFISKGNPIVVGWFWIFLIITFLIIGFRIAKKLFDEKTAYFYLILVSTFLIFQMKEFSHQQAAFLVMPLFFYTFWQYINTFRTHYLAFHVLIAGALIQFEVASGAPFLLLSLVYIIYLQIRRGKLKHFPVLFLILVPLSTYILFDLRHDFFLLKNLIIYIKGKPDEFYPGLYLIFKSRIDYMSTTAVPLVNNLTLLNRVLTIAILIVLSKIILSINHQGKNRKVYLLFFYFFFGYFILSLSSRYELLTQHFLPFVPIVFLVFASLVTSRYSKVFLPLLMLIIISNEFQALRFLRDSSAFVIGKNEDSWKFLAKLTDDVFNNSEQEFGYFVYSPDKLGYEPKYAMIYAKKIHPDKRVFNFEKKPVTYVISTPPPPNDPYMTEEFWIKNSLRIYKKPEKLISYPNGYKIYRYKLSQDETIITPDQWEDSGIHFR